jgi:hypothetical protein
LKARRRNPIDVIKVGNEPELVLADVVRRRLDPK